MRKTARWLDKISPALVLILISSVAVAQDKAPGSLPPDQASALDRITADSLKGHLSFLASDLLEGRDTPSRGLDLAAEYIAAQFRRAGLEPVGDDGYFQTANWQLEESDPSSFRLEITADGKSIPVDKDRVSLPRPAGLDVQKAGILKVDYKAAKDLKEEDVAGKVVLVELPDPRKVEQAEQAATFRAIGQFQSRMRAARPAAILNVSRDLDAASGLGSGRLIDPASPPAPGASGGLTAITVHDPAVTKLFEAMPVGSASATVSIRLDAPAPRPVKLRNVVGLLRGSDPELKESYVMVTAHYDHIGVRGPAGTDRIYNGANDDGSGTVSVVELATALASLKEKPRRSILFATFFGEEKGLLGSRYYGRNPMVPVEKTVADVNLEQVGRTDDSEGPQVSSAFLTGFGYSDVSKVFVEAGEAEGVKVFRHPTNSDAFFGRSDNQALADLGVPAHTLGIAFMFPDYHGAADHWDKVDYANMAKVDRMVARALLMIANDPEAPKWDESNPKAAKYLKAWKERHAK
ncbi:M28 family metallopeptidase [Tundrisphaera lichenicola]|uniref:M28 family metallopeptidase n=1 Tax=Tundrisphaera lichenicola TaxID=2029860 RepID=UPI003EB819B2